MRAVQDDMPTVLHSVRCPYGRNCDERDQCWCGAMSVAMRSIEVRAAQIITAVERGEFGSLADLGMGVALQDILRVARAAVAEQ